MKKIMAALLLLLLLTGCSATAQYPKSEFLGSWQAASGEKGGVKVSLEDINCNITLTLEASGKAVLETDGVTQEGKWSPRSGNKGIVLALGEDSIELEKIREGALKGSLEGVTMTFELEN